LEKDLITDDLCRQKATTFQPTPDVVASRGTISLSFFLNFQRLDVFTSNWGKPFLKHFANGLPLPAEGGIATADAFRCIASYALFFDLKDTPRHYVALLPNEGFKIRIISTAGL